MSPREIRADADSYVDELFADAHLFGASVLVAEHSRFVVDLNRTEADVDSLSVPSVAKNQCRHGHKTPCTHAPRGVIWRENNQGKSVLKAPLTREQYQHRIDTYYLPYHRALSERLQELREQFGYALLLCAHSMPSVGHGPDGTLVHRADVVPGTRGHTTADKALISLVDQHFRAAGLSVRHDDPYRGGATTVRWGRPVDGFHAVQIELNRALYLDEATVERRPAALSSLALLCSRLVERCAAFVPLLG